MIRTTNPKVLDKEYQFVYKKQNSNNNNNPAETLLKDN